MSGYGKGWHKIKNWNFKTIILGLAIRRMSNNGKMFLLAKIHCYQKILKCSRTLDFLERAYRFDDRCVKWPFVKLLMSLIFQVYAKFTRYKF